MNLFATTSGVSGENVRHLMVLAAVEHRFGPVLDCSTLLKLD
jgi:hypothetical protein